MGWHSQDDAACQDTLKMPTNYSWSSTMSYPALHIPSLLLGAASTAPRRLLKGCGQHCPVARISQQDPHPSHQVLHCRSARSDVNNSRKCKPLIHVKLTRTHRCLPVMPDKQEAAQA